MNLTGEYKPRPETRYFFIAKLEIGLEVTFWTTRQNRTPRMPSSGNNILVFSVQYFLQCFGESWKAKLSVYVSRQGSRGGHVQLLHHTLRVWKASAALHPHIRALRHTDRRYDRGLTGLQRMSRDNLTLYISCLSYYPSFRLNWLLKLVSKVQKIKCTN